MFAAILLPNFRLQAALRHRPELSPKPVAIVDDTQNDGTILELNPAAAAFGIAPGATSTQAMARCSHVRLLPRARPQELTAAAALLESAGTLSPEIEATADGVCTADLRSAKSENWQPLARTAITRLAALELRAQVGIAANPGLALLAARHAKGKDHRCLHCDPALQPGRAPGGGVDDTDPILVVQEPRAFLTGLAISELNPSRELRTVFEDWGIRHLGDLARLPKDGLVERLGPVAGELWEQAAGGAPRLLRLIRPAEEFTETFEFEQEIETTEPLLFILRRFLDQLSLRLRGAYRVAGKMTLTLFLESTGGRSSCDAHAFLWGTRVLADGQGLAGAPPSSIDAKHERHFTIPAPTADPEILFRILHTHLDGLHLDQRPIAIRLTIEPAIAHDHQFRLFDSPLRDPNRFGETLARIVALVGAGNSGVAELADTHRPDSFTLVEPRFDTDLEVPTNATKKKTATARKPASPHDPQPTIDLALGLPLRRFRPPFPAQVHLVRHIPAHVFSEKIHGEIIDAAGPYRLSGDWWDREKWAAEEWDIELPDGSLFRISKQRESWFIEGSYDTAPEAESPANIMEIPGGTRSCASDERSCASPLRLSNFV